MFAYRNNNISCYVQRERTRLLATAGVTVLMLSVLAIHPAPVFAAMTVTPGGSVQATSNTATTATTNTDGATTPSSDRIQLWNNGTPITAVINSTISGNGLALEETGSTAAAITMTGSGNITSTAASGVGLLLSSNGGNISYTGNGAVTGATGIVITNAGSGAVTLTTSKNNGGTAGDGIDTSAVNGNTLITVTGQTTKGFTGFAGINSLATGSGNLTVVVTAGTVGSATSAGIVLNQTGTGLNSITNNGSIFGAGTATNPTIAIAATNAGSTTIINNAGHFIYAGGTANAPSSSGLAILSTVTTGADIINNAGTLNGEVYLSNQSNALTNSGIWNVVDSGAIGYNAAAFGSSGHNTLTNSGTINAGILANNKTAATSTFSGVNILNNTGTINAGLYGAGDVTSFIAGGAATQTVTNSGTINVNGTLNFTATGTFTNAGGLIDMRVLSPYTGNSTADVTTLNVAVSGNSYTPGGAYNFVGGAGNEIGLDASVGMAASAGSSVPSDRLLISGTATGTTAILLNDTGGAVSYNPTGITLVAVNGASTNAFYLQSVGGLASGDILESSRGPMGSIKKGFWFFPLLQTPHGVAAADGLTGANSSEYRLYGLPDVEAFETPMAITGAEDIWYDTALGWNQRQEQLRKHWTGVYGAADAYADGKFNFWAKATGSWDNRSSSASLDAYSPVAGLFGSVDTGFKQNTYLAQVGTDVGFNRVLGKDGVLVLDASAGVIDSTLKFKGSGNEFDYSGVTVSGSVDYLNGGWFWDTLLKADVLQATLKYNSLAYFGDNQQSVEADTWGLMSSTGYHLNLGHRAPTALFLEPLLTIAYTSSTLGSFETTGTIVSFNDSDTFRGALGAKLGTHLSDGSGLVVDASVTGNYWNEFTNNAGADFPAAAPASSLTLGDVREKGYGEVAGQLNIANAGASWSGFLDGGAKFNSQFTSVELSGGIAFRW